jgi:nickel/cobalt transporter (NicO) family protein
MKTHAHRAVAVAALVGTAMLLTVQGVAAHPMGNFSINHYAAITVGPESVRVLYIVDMAEIPTFQELTGLGVNTGADVSGSRRTAYLSREARSLFSGLAVTYTGRRVALTVHASDLIFPPGAGGLSTERVYLLLSGSIPRRAGTLTYADSNFDGRAGWKEIELRAVGSARIQHSSAPPIDRSSTLTIYPSTLTSSPPQDTSATAGVLPGTAPPTVLTPSAELGLIRQAEQPLLNRDGSWSALARGLARTKASSGARGTSFAASRNDPLSALMGGRQLSAGVLLVSIVVAFWFGAGHALSPGHGKTIVAAYLVGSRGTAAHAALLGLTVTATHTAGVFALGLVTLYLSKYILPDQLYPILGFASGMLVALMGVTLFVRRLRARLASRDRASRSPGGATLLGSSSHDGQPGLSGSLGANGPAYYQPMGMAALAAAATSGAAMLTPAGTGRARLRRGHAQVGGDAHGVHRHGPFGMPHSHGTLPGKSAERVNIKSLLALGISGGLLPCPSALVVLLSAIAFHRIAFGMLLIVAFSLGLATVLTGIGILVVFSGRLFGRLQSKGSATRIVPVARGAVQILPIFSAGAVAALGTLIALGALNPAILPSFLPKF